MTAGGAVPAAAWNRLLDLAISSRVVSFLGGRIRRNRLGTSLEISPGSGTTHPFKLINASTEAEGARVRVVYGTVKVGGTTWVPKIWVGGALVSLDAATAVLAVSATGNVYLEPEWSYTRVARQVRVKFVAGAAPADALPTSTSVTESESLSQNATASYGIQNIVIGQVSVAGGAITDIAQGLHSSLQAELGCNGTYYHWSA